MGNCSSPTCILAADRGCTDALINNGVTAIAYETVEMPDRSLPSAGPDVRSGRPDGPPGRCVHAAARQWRPRDAARAASPACRRAKVVVLGGGVSGLNAAQIAVGMGANVTILDINAKRLAEIDRLYQGRLQTLMSSSYAIEQQVHDADLVIGAVLIPGAKAPKLVNNDLVSRMKPGAVLVDIAIDQGGCFEGSRPTTHADPTFKVHDTVFYCVANMPGAVPAHLDVRTDECDVAVRRPTGKQGLAAGAGRPRRTATRSEHPRGSDHLRGGRYGV